jgi:hypothetical protein
MCAAVAGARAQVGHGGRAIRGAIIVNAVVLWLRSISERLLFGSPTMTMHAIDLGCSEVHITVHVSDGDINLSGVFADSADCLEMPVDDVSRAGSMACAFLGKSISDGEGRAVLAELYAAYMRHKEQIDRFMIDTDPDAPSESAVTE